MLTAEMIRLIRNHSAGMVATVNDDGSPAVSPKATFVVLDPQRIAFGNIRSPATMRNLRRDPKTEVCFLDVLARKSVRIAGECRIVPGGTETDDVRDAFMQAWTDYLPHMREFVIIRVMSARMILSPAYDVGHTESELKAANLARLAEL